VREVEGAGPCPDGKLSGVRRSAQRRRRAPKTSPSLSLGDVGRVWLDRRRPASDHLGAVRSPIQGVRSPPETTIDPDLLRISVGPGALHVERFGRGGEPVVLVHGFGTSSFLWRAVAPALAQDGYSVFAIDMLGYGESDRPLEADYSIAAQAGYLERLLTALRLPAAHVVGIDVGGGVAQRLTATAAERVQRLVLINSVGLEECPGRDIKAVQRATARFALRVSRGMLGATALLRPVLEASVADVAHMPARLVARYLAPYVGAEGVTHLLTLARSVHREDLQDVDLGSIRARCLLVWGDEDRWLDSGLPERLRAAIPGCALARLPSVARLVPEEAPETLNALLSEFLRS
jgi:pimeloyl-ACP methyl ester carboxylesterase